jgi:ABC-type sugar transport system permease subunit
MNLFKKITPVFVLAIALSATFAGQSYAKGETAAATFSKLDPVECFEEGLYEFQSVTVIGGPELTENKAGTDILFRGEIKNSNNYPVVDGNLFVRLSRDNANYRTEGQNILDEFVAVSDVVIDASSTVPFQFVWKAPVGLPEGSYRVDYFFSVGKKFNLGGLPFTNEIIAGASSFVIKSSASLVFALDKSGTKINDTKYLHVGNWSSFAAGTKIVFSQPVKNYSDKDIKVDVDYSLYFWDSLNEKDLLNTKLETVTVPAGSTVNLSYTVDSARESDYYLKIKATSAGVSSIVNIRAITDIVDSRLNYPAITKFPVTKGQDFRVFSCYHNTNGVTPEANVTLKLLDENNNLVYSGVHKEDISTSMRAVASSVVAEKNYTYLKLQAEIVDKNGKNIDSYEAVYDCSVLKSAACAELNHKVLWSDVFLYFVVLLLVALVLFALSLVTKNHLRLKKVLRGLSALVVVIIVVLVGVFYLVNAKLLYAQTYPSDPTNYRQKVSVDNFGIGYSFRDGSGDGWGDRETGNVYSQRITRGQLVGNRNLQVNQEFYLDTSYECSFEHTGGHWDTPYCGTVSTIDLGNEGKLDIIDPGYSTTIQYDPTVLNCIRQSDNDYKCRAIAAGTSGVLVTVPAVSTSFKSCAEVDRDAGGVIVTTNNPNNSSPNCKQHGGPATYTYIGRKVSETSPRYNSNLLSVNFEKHEMYWDITVTGGSNPASCSDRIRNQDETGVDQGGVCENHSGGGNCHDGVRNGSESGVDYGGSCSVGVGQSAPGACIPAGQYANTPLAWCTSGSLSGWTPSGSPASSWTWNCLGVNGGTPQNGCTASLAPNPENPPSGDIDCSVVMVNSTPNVNVNTTTTWQVNNLLPPYSTYDKHWKVNGVNQVGANGTTFETIFTTIGLREVSFYVSTSSQPEIKCKNPATATTTVVLPGSTQER